MQDLKTVKLTLRIILLGIFIDINTNYKKVGIYELL